MPVLATMRSDSFPSSTALTTQLAPAGSRYAYTMVCGRRAKAQIVCSSSPFADNGFERVLRLPAFVSVAAAV
jgi:hypothetical protein